MKLYISAPFDLLQVARILSDNLRRLEPRLIVTSSWHEMDHPAKLTNKYLRACALQDAADVASSDIVMMLNLAEWENKGTGGRHFECGYAIAVEIPVLLVGRRSNALYHHPLVHEIAEEAPLSLILTRLRYIVEDYPTPRTRVLKTLGLHVRNP